MSILITGGAGFIGTHLCRHLIEDPHTTAIRVLDEHPGDAGGALASLGVDVVQGSILDAELLRSLASDAEVIVHLAATPVSEHTDPSLDNQVNVGGTLAVLEAARQSPSGGRGGTHVILASSSAVYGANPAIPAHEELTSLPRTPHAASKMAAEAFTSSYQHAYGLSALRLRLFDVYGPGQPAGRGSLVADFIDAALDGRPLPIHGDGRQLRDLIDVDTVCEVMVEACVERVSSPWPMNVASGRGTSVLGIAQLVAGCVGAGVTFRNENTFERPLDQRADTTRMNARFRRVRPVEPAIGIAAAVEAARERRSVERFLHA